MRAFAGILATVIAGFLFGIRASGGSSSQPTAIDLPGGSAGIGFDDLRFVPFLKRFLAPAGRTGNLALVDPASHAVTVVPGFAAKGAFSGGHDDGVTSADEGKGWIFATDRTSGQLAVVDPRTLRIVSRAKLSGPPDYVRFVELAGEVWVTQPDKERIEIFRLSESNPPEIVHQAFVSVPGGPESLVLGEKGGRAYTHLWNGKTVAIDVKKRAISASWDNGCKGSRGIALDEPRGLLFAGCAEGRAVALDAPTGRPLSSLSAGGGVDIIDYDPKLAHLYLPGGKSATMAVLAVSAKGKLSLLGTFQTAQGSHCVATDFAGNVLVCDPQKGRLLLFQDGYPSSR